jgi:hypothetical protein
MDAKLLAYRWLEPNKNGDIFKVELYEKDGSKYLTLSGSHGLLHDVSVEDVVHFLIQEGVVVK